MANKAKRVKHGSPAVTAILNVIALLIGLATLYPLVFIISNSISTPIEAAMGNVWLLPRGFSLQAYYFILQSDALGRAFFNSVVYTAFITVANVAVSMMCGYGLSKKDLFGKKIIQLYIVLPLWFSAGLIPVFLNMTRLGLVNTLWAVFLPSFVSIFNVILARTFITRLPYGIIEAAMIDGASVPYRFFNIVLPLCKPIIAVLALFTALGAWNEWFSYMIYLPTSNELHPLQFFLVRALLRGRALAELDLMDAMTMADAQARLAMSHVAAQLSYATIIVATVPIMFLYPFIQKHFIQGIMIGSLKE